MFHFPGFPPPALYIQAGVTPHHGCRVPPFGHPRINARLTAPRGLSRPPTSFIGSWYQGIHHAPLHTYTPDTPHPATPHGPTGRGIHVQTNIKALQQKPRKNLDTRCSHPLSSSQTPHEHPTPTQTPNPPPPPHPPGEPGRTVRKERWYVCGCGPATEETTHPHPPHHPPHPRHADNRGKQRRGWGPGPVPSGPNSAPPAAPTPGRAPASTSTPALELSATRLRCFHPRAHTRRHERPREGVPEPAAPAHYRRRTGRKAP